MGHSVDKLEYTKACRDEEWVRREYRKALPLLQIITGTEAYGLTPTDTVEALRKEVENLKKERDELKEIDEQRSLEMQADVKKELDGLKARMWNLAQASQTDPDFMKKYAEGIKKELRKELGIPEPPEDPRARALLFHIQPHTQKALPNRATPPARSLGA